MEELTEPAGMAARPPCGRRLLGEPPPEIAAALNVIGGKWKILILWQLLRQTCRFNQFRRSIAGISQHMLTAHLRQLEQEGVVSRRVFAEVPPRVEYSLTPRGQELSEVMRTLAQWGSAHADRPSELDASNGS